MDPIEIIAVSFGLACVALTTRQNIWCWPTGLVQVTLYVYIFYQTKLYSDMILHIIYIFLQFYGWYHWLYGGRDQQPLPVTRLPRDRMIVWALVAIVGTAALGGFMFRFTDASLPFWDAAILVLSLIAQYLLARKLLENWWVWILVDVIAIGVYTAKELYLTAVLYAVFLCLCVYGLVAWLKTRVEPAAA